MLDQLYALNRPDWKEHLSFWDTEIAKARIASNQPDGQSQIKMAMLSIEGPVWLKPDSTAAELFPARSEHATTITFLGSCAEIPTNSKRMERQMADARGRMSRALP